MTTQEIYKKLQEYTTSDRLQMIRAEYKGTDEGFIQSVNQILKELDREHKFKVYDYANNLSMNDRHEEAEQYIKLNMPNVFIDTLRNELNSFIPIEVVEEVIQIVTQFEHSNIFVGNAYEVWKKLFNDFNIKKRNSRDLNFMFEAMKNKGLIHENITLSYMEEWINKNHGDYQCEKLRFSDIKDYSNRNRVTIFEGIIANTKI